MYRACYLPSICIEYYWIYISICGVHIYINIMYELYRNMYRYTNIYVYLIHIHLYNWINGDVTSHLFRIEMYCEEEKLNWVVFWWSKFPSSQNQGPSQSPCWSGWQAPIGKCPSNHGTAFLQHMVDRHPKAGWQFSAICQMIHIRKVSLLMAGGWNKMSFKVLSTQTILWFCDLILLIKACSQANSWGTESKLSFFSPALPLFFFSVCLFSFKFNIFGEECPCWNCSVSFCFFSDSQHQLSGINAGSRWWWCIRRGE